MERFGRKVTEVRNRFQYVSNEKLKRSGSVRRYIELPIVESEKSSVDADGEVVSITKLEAVGFGKGPRPESIVDPYEHRPRSTRHPEPGSSFHEANMELFKEMRLPDTFIDQRMPSLEALDRFVDVLIQIQPAWETYQRDPSDETKQVLLSAMEPIFVGRTSVTQRKLEKLLLQISRDADPMIAGQALCVLASFCPFRYLSTLDAHIRHHQIANPEWHYRIGASMDGVPAELWEAVPLPVESLPRKLHSYAPASVMIPILLEDYHKGGESNAEYLIGYDDDRVRRLFVTTLPDNPRDAMDKMHSVVAAGVYPTDGSEKILISLLDSLNAAVPEQPQLPADQQWLFEQRQQLLRLWIVQALLNTQNKHALKEAARAMTADTKLLLLSATGVKESGNQHLLLSVAPQIDDLSVKKLKGTSLRFLFFEETIIPGTPEHVPLLYTQAFVADIDGILTNFLPFYQPGKDYGDEILAYRKSWNRERVGLPEPEWSKVPRERRDALLLEILPTYGEEGYAVLKDLVLFPEYQSNAMFGLIKTGLHRENTLELLRSLERPRASSRYRAHPSDVALWVLGDRSVREDMENWLRFGNMDIEAMHLFPWIDRAYLISLAKRHTEFHKRYRYFMALGLSRHADREAWELILDLWPKEASPYIHLAYGHLFNDAAGRNFGQDREAMRAWVQTLPKSSSASREEAR